MLYRNEATVNLSAEVDLGEYTHEGDSSIIVQARIDLDDIVGNFTYTFYVYVNDFLISPESSVAVPTGRTTAIAQSRTLILNSGDVIRFSGLGDAADVSVSSVLVLADVTPISAADVIAEIEPAIENTIRESMTSITVRPERTVLGACRQQVVSFRRPVR
jgi:hypothetical protein